MQRMCTWCSSRRLPTTLRRMQRIQPKTTQVRRPRKRKSHSKGIEGEQFQSFVSDVAQCCSQRPGTVLGRHIISLSNLFVSSEIACNSMSTEPLTGSVLTVGTLEKHAWRCTISSFYRPSYLHKSSTTRSIANK